MISRYELVWFRADAAILADEADRSQVATWCAAGRPAIVRSAAPCDAADRVPLGIPLPLDQNRRRISLSLDPAAILFRDVLPDLETSWPWGLPAWQQKLRDVAERCAELEIDVRVHGSLGWQVLTNETYLRPESDVDLLLRAPRGLAPDALTDLLGALAASTEPRFDGEIFVERDGTTAFRELLSDAPQVLVKYARSATLVARTELGLA